MGLVDKPEQTTTKSKQLFKIPKEETSPETICGKNGVTPAIMGVTLKANDWLGGRMTVKVID